jgi:hypothetical protein
MLFFAVLWLVLILLVTIGTIEPVEESPSEPAPLTTTTIP